MGKAQVAGCAGGAGVRMEQACSHHCSGHCRTSWEERKKLLAGLARWLVNKSENKVAGSCLGACLGASVLLVRRNRYMRCAFVSPGVQHPGSYCKRKEEGSLQTP